MKFQNAEIVRFLKINQAPRGQTSRFWIDLVANGIGQSILVPVIIVRGLEDGPVLGLTAVVHGNELNGLRIVQRILSQLDPKQMKGCVVGVPVVNVPSILNQERRFMDGEDLNRLMPGKEGGNHSDVYAYRIMERIVAKFDYLIDLHTASFGRINSYYIRANMNDPVTARLAELQNAQIILNNPGSDGTLRSAAYELGIHSITVEVGDPNRFQKGMIRSGTAGIYNVLSYLGITQDVIEESEEAPYLCENSYWVYADRGGILEVFPDVTDWVRQGQIIAVVRSVFGDTIKEYRSPEDGVVIGKSVHPISQTGGRILHLGIIDKTK
ncbi:MAG: succinylglutamate desuccinylase/aspartoacylase family protein [Bacteroidia bacterium]|nr:succinylglutamate desuccinylase/aspartoacylase family protein [Bacteroidia bacterium]